MDTKEIQRIRREFFKNPYPPYLENLKEMDKFLDIYTTYPS